MSVRTPRLNDFGQPIGPDLPGWTPRPQPTRTPMVGRQVRLEPLETKRHARDLFEADRNSEDAADWTYLPNEPMYELADYEAWCAGASTTSDPLFFAIIDLKSGRAVGRAAFMRIDATNGVMEVGHIKFSPLLQRSALATEAMFLMMRRAFDELGYRRYEWKCDDLNEPSKRAARRLGFIFEGLFRNAVVVKGRSRDTAWFSIIDSEWPKLRAAFEHWLAPENFSADGAQKESLSKMIEESRS
jgi:RimJ/RimL family protein N-acetyltransferase